MKFFLFIGFYIGLGCSTALPATQDSVHQLLRALPHEPVELRRSVNEIPPCVLLALRRWMQRPFILINWNESFPPLTDIRHAGDGQFRLLFFSRLSPSSTLLCFQDNGGIGRSYRAFLFSKRDGRCVVKHEASFAGPVWSIKELRVAIIENLRYQMERDREYRKAPRRKWNISRPPA